MYTHHNTKFCDVLQCWIAWSLTNSESSLPQLPRAGEWRKFQTSFYGIPLKKQTELLWFGDMVTTILKEILMMISDVFLVDPYFCLSWELTKTQIGMLWEQSVESMINIKATFQKFLKKKHRFSNWEITWAVSERKHLCYLLLFILLVAWETDPYCSGCL